MKPEKKSAVVVAMDTAVKVANTLKAIDAAKPEQVVEEKKVKTVVVKTPPKKEESQPANDKASDLFRNVPQVGGRFGLPVKTFTPPAAGEPARFTSDHRNWRARPVQANEIEKVLSKTGNAVTDKEFKLLAGAVAINGVLLEPVTKGMQYFELQTIGTNKHGIHLPEGSYPHSLYSQKEAPGPFDVYQFELNGENVVLILDADSSFWFAGDSYFYQNTSHHQFSTSRYSEEVVTKGGAAVLLENSHLKNCGVIGTVCILNGDFRNFDLNNSRYQHSKEINPRFRFSATVAETPEPVTKHPEIRGGSLVNSRINNSKISSGYYQNSHITDSCLEFGENHYSSIVRSQITDSTIKAKSQVMIVDASFYHCTFNGSQLGMAGFSLEHVNLYLENVFAPTKVCISKFDAVDSNHNAFQLIRTGPAKVTLYRHSASHGNLVINLADDDEILRVAIKEWLQSNENNTPFHGNEPTVKGGVIAKSIARYTIDNVMARLASIRLLDEVHSLTRNTAGQSGYSLYDLINY